MRKPQVKTMPIIRLFYDRDSEQNCIQREDEVILIPTEYFDYDGEMRQLYYKLRNMSLCKKKYKWDNVVFDYRAQQLFEDLRRMISERESDPTQRLEILRNIQETTHEELVFPDYSTVIQ